MASSNLETKPDFPRTEHRVRAVIKTFPLSKLNELVTEYRKGSGGKLVIDMSLET